MPLIVGRGSPSLVRAVDWNGLEGGQVARYRPHNLNSRFLGGDFQLDSREVGDKIVGNWRQCDG